MSGPGDWIATVVGVGLLLLLAWDVFATTFHATGRGGPVNRTLNRLLWRLARWVGRGADGPRGRILALAGPLMAFSTIVLWAVLLVTGHAILYLLHMTDFHYGTGAFGSAVQEALTYSGIVASTLGLGDVVPPDGPLRFVTVTEALGGFGLLTVSVTYVLAVYRELIEARGLAAEIDAYVPGEAWEGMGSDVLGGRQAELASRILQVTEAHHQYPILHYFRPSDHRHALPVQLDRLLRLYEAAETPAQAGGATGGGMSEAPTHRALRRAVSLYVEDVHRMFVPGRVGGEGRSERARRQLDDLLAWLRYPSRPDRQPGGSDGEPAAAGEESADREKRWS